MFARRKAAFAFLLIRLNASIQNTVSQLSLSGSAGFIHSPAGTNGKSFRAFSSTPSLSSTLQILSRKRSIRCWKKSFSVTLSFEGWTLFAKVNTTRAWSHKLLPNVVVTFLIVLASSSRNLMEVISKQNRKRSTAVIFFLICSRYFSSLPVSSANPGVSKTVIFTLFLQKSYGVTWK